MAQKIASTASQGMLHTVAASTPPIITDKTAELHNEDIDRLPLHRTKLIWKE